MRPIAPLGLMLVAAFLVAGCAAPRGVGLSSEILQDNDAAGAPFDVVAVTRDNVAQLRGWPVTGDAPGSHWIEARRGPDSAVIRTGDQINLVIWDSQENSLLAAQSEKAVTMPGLTVSSAGTIFVPYLDEVVVDGQTPDQARRQIQEALTPIVPSAQVQLSVVAGRQNSVDLVSGVPRPGTYPLPDRNYSILSLIAQGGGIGTDLRNPVVRLLRSGKRYDIPAARLLSEPSKNAVLRGGDQVLVEEDARYFTALGAAGTQNLIYFPKDDITAIETLALIGGLEASRADPKGVLVLRDYAQAAVRTDGRGPARTQVVFTFDLTTADGLFAARAFRINPKDTVLVTESALVGTRSVIGLIGSALGLADRVIN